MAKREENSSSEQAEPGAAKASPSEAGSTPAESEAGDGAAASAGADKSAPAPGELPTVESPNIDGDEDTEQPDAETANEISRIDAEPLALAEILAERVRPNEPAFAAAPAPQPRSFRFVLLAAAIAFAAGAGSFVGAMTASGIGHRAAAENAMPKTADARDMLQAMKAELAQLAAVKANLDNATRSANSQYAKIAERLDSLEHAEADPAAKLARIAEAVDRLDKRPAAAPEITGSIASNPPSAAPAPTPAPKLTGPILDGWIVQDVRNGRAMVESRYGGIFLVGSGSTLPGLGRVEAVKRQDGQWVVITASGVITSEP
jgi:hypothetical protein